VPNYDVSSFSPNLLSVLLRGMRLLLGTILIVLLLLAAGKAGAQSLSVVNHTGCSLRFAVGVAAGNPCGSVCYREERLPPLTTIKWPATQMTDWGCDTTRLYWHSFYLAQDHQTKIGQCNLPASATVTTTTCGTALTLSWRVTKEGYIEVSIDSTGNKAIPTKAEKLYYTYQSGKTIPCARGHCAVHQYGIGGGAGGTENLNGANQYGLHSGGIPQKRHRPEKAAHHAGDHGQRLRSVRFGHGQRCPDIPRLRMYQKPGVRPARTCGWRAVGIHYFAAVKIRMQKVKGKM
jgi:hypothetical protein